MKSKKRNASGMGTIRKRPDGRWEARFTTGFDPKTGKQIQHSVYGSSQKEVKKKLTDKLSEISNGTYIEPCDLTVEQWLQDWVENYIGNIKESSAKTYEDRVNVNIIPKIGKVRISQLSPAQIQRMYNSFQRDDNLSPKTIRAIHGVLHRAMEQAKNLGYIQTNPTESVILPRVSQKEIVPLDDNSLDKFLQAIKGSPYENVFYVDVFTGLRKGEILGLTWDCVNFEKRTLLINKQFGKNRKTGEYEFSSLKNDKPRVIEVAPSVIDVLKKQRFRQYIWAEVLGESWDNPYDLVFTTETGKYLCGHTVYNAFKRIVRNADMGSVRFHDLRHTYAVNSLKIGDDIKTVQGNLGHHSASFTLDVYGHVTDEMRHSSASRMESYISSINSSKGSE